MSVSVSVSVSSCIPVFSGVFWGHFRIFSVAFGYFRVVSGILVYSRVWNHWNVMECFGFCRCERFFSLSKTFSLS